MKQVISKMGPLLTRLFKTNWLTTAGGIISLAGVVLLIMHLIDKETAVEFVGGGGTLAGIGAKDGIRDNPTVAAESLTAPDVAGGPPTSAAVLLLFLGLGALTACVAAKSPTPPLNAVSAALMAPSLQHGQPAAAPDTLPAAPVPPYLVAPPAGLTPRQVRQFRRAQRRALIEASRQAPYKLKQGAGSAYAAPDGTAVALRKPAGPVGVGPGAAVTDNSNVGRNANGGVGAAGADWSGTATGATAPKPSTWEQRLAGWWGRAWPWLVGAGIVYLAAPFAISSGPWLIGMLRGLRPGPHVWPGPKHEDEKDKV